MHLKTNQIKQLKKHIQFKFANFKWQKIFKKYYINSRNIGECHRRHYMDKRKLTVQNHLKEQQLNQLLIF